MLDLTSLSNITLSTSFDSVEWEVFKTLAAASAGALANYARRRVSDATLRRRYPVAGRYFSRYEDIQGDQRVVEKAHITLEQRGLRFTGYTSLITHPPKRSWQIRGEIVDARFLTGAYFSSNPHDKSRGTFFLDTIPGNPHEYEGSWTGYDSVNRLVTGGAYHWVLMQPLQIRLVRPRNHSEANAALALLGEALGDRYVNESSYAADIRAEGSSRVTLALADAGIIGVQIFGLLLPAEIQSFQLQVTAAGARRNFKQHKLGILRSVAVKPEYRGRGVASQLTANAIQRLKAWGATAAIAVSWQNPDGPSSLGMLMAHGLDPIAEIPDYWRQDSITRQYHCPACGNPCSCTAIVVFKVF